MRQAAVVTRGLGLPDLAIAEYPGVPMTDSLEVVTTKVIENLLPAIIDGLGRPRQAAAPVQAEQVPAAHDVVVRGSFDEVNDFFYQRHWSDGLPIVPPTRERVERFLAFTDRAPDEPIGAFPPANRLATVWNVAVNGVMAGCRPEYMPVLLAVAEAVADPLYKVEDAGSTPGWESMVVVSGPIIQQLEFCHGQGVMRTGKRANTSVGRFLRLLLRNIGGFHHSPEGADKGSIGQSFLVAAAENEACVAELGWQPYSVDRGFKAGDNIVTVQSVVAISAPVYSGSEHAAEHAEMLADVIGQRACGYWTAIGMAYANWHPLIMLGPSIARVFAKDGWSKDDLRRYFFEKVKIRAVDAERYAWGAGVTGFRIAEHVKNGLLPATYMESDDPNRLIPVFPRAEWIGIVVAGDEGRNQSKGYVSNHVQGPPVSKPIRLPRDWDRMLAAR